MKTGIGSMGVDDWTFHIVGIVWESSSLGVQMPRRSGDYPSVLSGMFNEKPGVIPFEPMRLGLRCSRLVSLAEPTGRRRGVGPRGSHGTRSLLRLGLPNR